MSGPTIKEQIDAILEAGDMVLKPPADLAEFIDKPAVKWSRTDQIHEAYKAWFTAELDKLTVVELSKISRKTVPNVSREWIAGQQLNHSKDQLQARLEEEK